MKLIAANISREVTSRQDDHRGDEQKKIIHNDKLGTAMKHIAANMIAKSLAAKTIIAAIITQRYKSPRLFIAATI